MKLPNFLKVPRISRALMSLALVGFVLVSGCTWKADAVATEPREIERASSVPPTRSDAQTLRYRLEPAPLVEIPQAGRGEAPFRLLASGSENARIVDPDGNVIRSAEPGGTIFSFAWSPNRQWVLLYFGGAKYSVALATSLEDIVRPPPHPEGHDDATGISWFILDDDLLLGQADLPSLETEGLTASEKDGLPPRDTLIFIYSVSANVMMPVEVDSRFPIPFSIFGALDGRITLLTFADDEQVGARIVRSADH